MKKHTIITHFDETGYQKLDDVINLDPAEKISHIPYGRVPDDIRYLTDTLPLHITVSSSAAPITELRKKMAGFFFRPFDVWIDGIELIKGHGNSTLLCFKVRRTEETNALLNDLFERTGNTRYKPENAHLHVTICVSKDHNKIQRIKTRTKEQFSPFSLRVMSLGLYEIWPGVLKSIYYATP